MHASLAEVPAASNSAKLLAILESPDTSANDRAQACQDLAAVGGAEAVAPLAKLLDDPQLSHYARYGLQTNPAPAAGEALLRATARLKGDLLVGVVNSLGARGETTAIPLLADLAIASDRSLAIAAAGALADIDTDDALAKLCAIPKADCVYLIDPLIECAERLASKGSHEEAAKLLRKIDSLTLPAAYRKAALLLKIDIASSEDAIRLLEAALASKEDWKFETGVQFIVRSSQPATAKLLAGSLSTSLAERKLQLLAAIEACGDRVAAPAVREAAKSDDLKIRAAAIRGLGSIGEAADVSLFFAAAVSADSTVRENALAALGAIEGDQAADELVARLASPDESIRAIAAQVLGRRRIQIASSQLLSLASSDPAPAARLAALEALTRIASPSFLPELLNLASSTAGPEQRAARTAALAAASRVADRDQAAEIVASRIENGGPDNYGFLFDALLAIGGEQALLKVAKAANSPARQIQNEATRVLGSWPTSDAAPVALRVASGEHPYRVRALRGYLRIVRQFNFSEEERVEMIGKALAVAGRDEERQLAVSILEKYPCLASLKLAEGQLAKDLLGAKASGTVVKIAEQVANQHPSSVAEAARQVLKVGGEQSVLDRAQRLVSQSQRK